jgi:hypothetical protein
MIAESQVSFLPEFSSILHMACGWLQGRRNGRIKGTEIDAIASLSPISWRHSSLGVVTGLDRSRGRHQVPELDNPHPAPIASPRKRIYWEERKKMVKTLLHGSSHPIQYQVSGSRKRDVVFPLQTGVEGGGGGEREKEDSKHLLLLFHKIKHKTQTTQKNLRRDRKSNLIRRLGD